MKSIKLNKTIEWLTNCNNCDIYSNKIINNTYKPFMFYSMKTWTHELWMMMLNLDIKEEDDQIVSWSAAEFLRNKTWNHIKLTLIWWFSVNKHRVDKTSTFLLSISIYIYIFFLYSSFETSEILWLYVLCGITSIV